MATAAEVDIRLANTPETASTIGNTTRPAIDAGIEARIPGRADGDQLKVALHRQLNS
jgi:hypothetical protein